MTESLETWLWENHKELVTLIILGRTDWFTPELQAEYEEWLSKREDTNEGD